MGGPKKKGYLSTSLSTLEHFKKGLVPGGGTTHYQSQFATNAAMWGKSETDLKLSPPRHISEKNKTLGKKRREKKKGE